MSQIDIFHFKYTCVLSPGTSPFALVARSERFIRIVWEESHGGRSLIITGLEILLNRVGRWRLLPTALMNTPTASSSQYL